MRCEAGSKAKVSEQKKVLSISLSCPRSNAVKAMQLRYKVFVMISSRVQVRDSRSSCGRCTLEGMVKPVVFPACRRRVFLVCITFRRLPSFSWQVAALVLKFFEKMDGA